MIVFFIFIIFSVYSDMFFDTLHNLQMICQRGNFILLLEIDRKSLKLVVKNENVVDKMAENGRRLVLILLHDMTFDDICYVIFLEKTSQS